MHHYAVSIVPDVPPAKNRRIYQVFEDSVLGSGACRPVYDGRKALYSVKELEDEASYMLDYYEDDDPIAKR